MFTRQLAPFGLEIEGCNIATADADELRKLIPLLVRARVAVFRGQRIGDAEFVRFLQALGEITFTDGETPVEGVPELNVVSNVGRATPPRSVFHSDTSYVDRPPSFTALRPVALPERGGTTVFSDQVRNAAMLPPKYRAWLDGRTLLHRASGLAENTQATRHPLFRRHPVSGEVSLFLSTPERCTALSGVDEETSARVVRALYLRSVKPTAIYTHVWQPNDLLIWDNRVTMHKADHTDVHGDRVLHRGMVRGEHPVAA